MEKKFKEFGLMLRYYRRRKGESIKELAKSIGVGRTYLSRIENGHEKASEDLFWKIIDHFSLNDKPMEISNFALLIGFKPKVFINNQKEVNVPMLNDQNLPKIENKKNKEFEIISDNKPILYTDSVFITRNDYGIIFDFAQTVTLSNKLIIVSRIGMSHKHAEALLKVLEAKVKETKTKNDNEIVKN